MKYSDLYMLMQKLAYQFKDINILQEALCHSSYANELVSSEMRDNERLEFLGDAVLNLAIGDILMKRYPDLNEGALSRIRSNLVNEVQLARIAQRIDLGSYLQLGKGEIQSNGREKKSILANTFEAVIAAVHLDGGFDTACKIINTQFSALFNNIMAPTANQDYKSQLQELVQTTHKMKIRYRVIRESGPDHDKTFNIRLNIGKLSAEGIGKSKKIAEQDAAKNALEILSKNDKI